MTNMTNMTKYFLRLIVFNDNDMMQKFKKWREPSKLMQMRVAAFITAFLYAAFSVLSQFISPPDALPLMTLIHLYVVAPLACCIGMLSFAPKFQNNIALLLSFASIVAVIGNLIILVNLKEYTIYLPEIYLLLFWIFTMSGLSFSTATATAALVFIISLFGVLVFIEFSKELFFLHIFWMIAATLFGFLTSFFLERSHKIIFVKKEELEKLAMTDVLTGLFNRKKLETVLCSELSRSERYGHKLVFVFVDIDHFKDVNDTFGHQVGDDVLVEIAKLIKLNIRETDILIRWGGEEFVILFLETDSDVALKLAENLRKKVEENVFEKVGTKTISLGLTVNEDGDTPDVVIKRADEALYRAKNNGRNRVEISIK